VLSPFLDVCVILIQMFNDVTVSKDNLIDSLYKVMCTGTHTASDSKVSNNDYFKRRVLGFRAEIEFEDAIINSNKGFKFLEGGMFFSPKLDGSKSMKNSFLYVTFDTLPPDEYTNIYSKISSWNEVERLIYVQLNLNHWTEESFTVKIDGKLCSTNILVPVYEFYDFDFRNQSFTKSNNEPNDFFSILSIGRERKNKAPTFALRKRDHFDFFNDYDLDTLKKIYANRYFVDNKKRQVVLHMIDFDGFIIHEDKIFIVEIKEKSPIKDKKEPEDLNKWSYGWDTRRLLWYKHIQQEIGFDVLYNIRQINNRDERKFIQWDSIFLSDFLKGVSWSSVRGGGGGEDTLIVPYLHFKRLEENLI